MNLGSGKALDGGQASNCLCIRLYFVLEKGPRARKHLPEPLPSAGKGQLALGPGAVPGKVCEGLGRELTGGGQEGEPWLRGLVSVVLDFAYPKRLFFPSFAKYFSEMENNLSV